MESYIVRVYATRPHDRSPLSGVVEVVSTGGLHAFVDRDQLWQILSSPSLAGEAVGEPRIAPPSGRRPRMVEG